MSFPACMDTTESIISQIRNLDKSELGGCLRLADRFIGDEGCNALMKVIKHNERLHELDLSGCNIYRADELADIIRNTPSLRKLKLEWNSLGLARTGIASLASAIASHPSLDEVDLRSNRIGPSTVSALAQSLRNSAAPTSIDLRWNDIGPSGGAALLAMLERNHFITDLKLTGNGIPPLTLSHIEKLLERNRSNVLRRAMRPAPPTTKTIDSLALDAMNSERVAILQRDLTRFKEDMVALKNSYEHLARDKASADVHLQAVEKKLAMESEAREAAEKRGDELQRALSSTNKKMHALEDEHERCRRASDSELANVSGRLAAETVALKAVEHRARELGERYDSASAECKELKEQMARMKAEHSDQVHSLEKKLRSDEDYRSAEIQHLHTSLETRDKQHMDEIAKMRAKHAAEAKVWEQNLHKAKAERDAAQLSLQDMERLRDMAVAAASSAEEKHQRRERSLREEKKAEIEAVEARAASLERLHIDAAEKAEAAANEITRLRKALLAKAEESDRVLSRERLVSQTAEARRTEAEAKASTLENRIASLQSEIAQARARQRAAEETVTQLKIRLEEDALSRESEAASHAEALLEVIASRDEAKKREKRSHEELISVRRALQETKMDLERRNAELARQLASSEAALEQQFASLRAAAL